MKKLMDNKVLKILYRVLKGVFITMIILFVFMVCLQRFSNNRLSVFNFRLFTVISGSMEPKYNIGDVLVAVEVDPSEVKVGDAVSYLGTKRDLKNKIVTHEVTEIEQDSAGKYYFHTKGICKDCILEDPIVSESQLYGVVKYKVKTLSYIYKVIGTTYGLFLFVILPLLYIVGSEIMSALLEREERRRNRV